MNLSDEGKLYLIIFCIATTLLLGLGFPIANSIHDSTTNRNLRYLRAVQVESESLFDYAIRTEVGDMLSHGTFIANEPVTHEDLDGEYWSIIRIEEHEEQRTRTITYSCGTVDNPRTCTRVETYWVWVERGRETWSTETFNYLGRDFKVDDLDGVRFDFHTRNTTIRGGRRRGNRVRYVYRTIPVQFDGSMYSFAVDGNIISNNLFRNQTIEQVIESSENAANRAVMIFWFLWTSGGGVITFLIIRKLEDK